MLVIHYPHERYETPCYLVLGCFDGIHAGHQFLIDRAKRHGLPVGLMMLVGKNREHIFTVPERLSIYEKLGVDFCYFVPFDEEVKHTPAERFAENLRQSVSAKGFVCGEDFRFGDRAVGTPAFLEEQTGLPVECYPLLQTHGKKISSRLVREYLAKGEVEEANRLLSVPFSVTGVVEHGRRVGRKIGFPTANIRYPEEKTPLKAGVYAVSAEIEGKTYRGIANYGSRPTFDLKNVLLETYLDGFEGDLYGKELTVRFDFFLREIQKFSSAEELKAQLMEDKEKIR